MATGTNTVDTRYARPPDGAYIAYQTLGAGEIDLHYQLDYFGNLDMMRESPWSGQTLSRLATFARVIVHDRRATGLSSRNVPVPNLETRVGDMRSVLDAAGADRPVLFGEREGGTPNVLLAATDPQRVRSIVWYGPAARSLQTPTYPWGVPPAYVQRDASMLELWGTAAFGEAFVATEAEAGHVVDTSFADLLSKLSRQTCTPDVANELSRVWLDTDISDVLPSVRVPTLLLAYRDDETQLGEARHIASVMPEAELVILPGSETDMDFGPFVDAIRGFLGVDRAPDRDTVLATVLFTDIVGSTERQAALGDYEWTRMLERHHELVRQSLDRFRGVENDTAGDGFFATFDGPARAIRCAMAIAERVRELGVEIRAGLHTGECEIVEGKHAGLAVSIGARVVGEAGPSEVLVSRTVRDLVAGSGFTFEDAGERVLKGVPERWQLFRVSR
jgi:class 3 adenylate cyclase/pimeloyl-ACP methyl ester carboxylesterase